jgi:hypothetical protein
MHGWQTPGQALGSVCARSPRPPSGTRLTFYTTVSVDLGPLDVSALLVLTLEVSLEEEWHIYTPGTINLLVLNHS